MLLAVYANSKTADTKVSIYLDDKLSLQDSVCQGVVLGVGSDRDGVACKSRGFGTTHCAPPPDRESLRMATMFEGRRDPRFTDDSWRRARRRSRSAAVTTFADPARSARTLDSLIQAEIIPRLLIAHSGPFERMVDPAAVCSLLTLAEARDFAALPLVLEADELLERVETFVVRGVSVESILIDLLAPSARHLGEMWERDECDFVDVTMGLWRLQEVMREIAMRVPAVRQAMLGPRRALFSPIPGEQHSFGALVIAEVFTRAGWNAEALIEPIRPELLRTLAERNFDLVGLTVSCDCPSARLSELITAMRSVSKNSGIQVFIGGRVVNADTALVDQVGADGTAHDAMSALALAEVQIPDCRLSERVV